MICCGGGELAKPGKYILSLIVRNSRAAVLNFDAQQASVPATGCRLAGSVARTCQ
jgi:hypothetical protein